MDQLDRFQGMSARPLSSASAAALVTCATVRVGDNTIPGQNMRQLLLSSSMSSVTQCLLSAQQCTRVAGARRSIPCGATLSKSAVSVGTE